MATEILLNDGGAPARILPFIAEAAITGGTVVGLAQPQDKYGKLKEIQ